MRGIMKFQNEIDLLKKQTWVKHQSEDGIIDIMLGIVLMLLALNSLTDNPALFVVFLGLFPMLGKRLKSRYVYPRIGMAVYKKKQANQQLSIQWIIAAILLAGLAGFVASLFIKSRATQANPLFNVIGVAISGLVILGGISRQNGLYLYAILLAIPMVFLQYIHGLWIGMAMLICIIILLIGSIIWIIVKGNKTGSNDITDRPGNVAHAFLAEAGLIFFAYFLLSTYYPEFSFWLKQLVSANLTLVLGNVFALAVLGVGIAFWALRFCLYAALISVTYILYSYLLDTSVHPAFLLLGIGVIIFLSGIGFLTRFVRTYPVLEGQTDAA
jgi:hypothetical protein